MVSVGLFDRAVKRAALVRAARRRAALVAGGCATYELGKRGDQPVITCFCCGLTSCHDQDVALHYCGFCNTFHSDWGPAQ